MRIGLGTEIENAGGFLRSKMKQFSPHLGWQLLIKFCLIRVQTRTPCDAFVAAAAPSARVFSLARNPFLSFFGVRGSNVTLRPTAFGCSRCGACLNDLPTWTMPKS